MVSTYTPTFGAPKEMSWHCKNREVMENSKARARNIGFMYYTTPIFFIPLIPYQTTSEGMEIPTLPKFNTQGNPGIKYVSFCM